MKAWNTQDAESAVQRYAEWGEDIALRVYSSRLLGSQPDLVLHGGGNTSVKTKVRDLLGRSVPVLAVKGSGWDLATIEPQGFPQVRLEPLAELRQLTALDDQAMVSQLRGLLMDSHSPNPSVETLLHAFIPAKFIDHAHADAILAFANQPDAAAKVSNLFGERFGIVPYIMPGFSLAKAAAEVYDRNPEVEGLILLQHGIFTFGSTAQEAYQRMIDAVEQANQALQTGTRHNLGAPQPAWTHDQRQEFLTVLRGAINRRAGRPGIVTWRANGDLDRVSQLPQWRELVQRGPMTPDHVIRTKQKPLVLDIEPGSGSDWKTAVVRAVDDYVDAYEDYFNTQQAQVSEAKNALDPLPRIALVPGIGIVGMAPDKRACQVAIDLFEHTLKTTLDAEHIGTYQPLSDRHIFDMEYWSLEQAKLGRKTIKPLDGQVALVTGAGGGIGAAVARLFLAQGCHLVVTDRDEKALTALEAELASSDRVLALVADLSDPSSAERLLTAAVDAFGGLDILVSNAGIAFTGRIDEDHDVLMQSMDINFWTHQRMASAASRWFIRQGTAGCLLFNASKSAFNPGPGFGPYSVPKAALIALCKQYAVDLARFGIRSNAINADRIRTGLFNERLLHERAAARGIDIDAYFRANMLAVEVTAKDVAQAFLFAATAEKTTGSVLQVDGGNIAASPR